MEEPFLRFEWYVSPAYHWQDWLDERGKPVVVPNKGFVSLESPSAVELAWERSHEAKKPKGPVLGPVLDAGKEREYRPMEREHATLFRTFAALDYLDKKAILAFASEYGLLGSDRQEQGPTSTENGDIRYVFGESHLTWAREICLMREALHLARPRTDADDAREREAWGKHGLKPPYDENRRKLAWLFNLHLQHVQGRMIVEPDLPPRLSLAPLTLLAAMWLQLALAVSGDKQFRECKFCRRLFEISTGDMGFRRHREFCSDSCKTKDYRRRRRTALDMGRKGTAAATISKRLDMSVATVRKWLADAKSKKKDRN